MTPPTAESVLGRLQLAHALDADTPHVQFRGRSDALPSPFAVAPFASASVAHALACIAMFDALRTQQPTREVVVDQLHAAAAFRSERLLAGIGFTLPSGWDPIAGDYASADGYVRLHTNYAHHRAAALRALDVPEDRAAVAAAVRVRSAESVEEAVVAAGGAAAALRSAAEWRVHPQGAALAHEPLVHVTTTLCAAEAPAPGSLPLSGVRVLDLTRVIAGPVCTRLLAAYGADVLRIDPPDFGEVPALLGDTTWGKHRATLDLRSPAGEAALAGLLARAHVVVVGYRSSALPALGLAPERLRAEYPGLIVAMLNAYGHTGPWQARRGFDSLVQMSAGFAERGRMASGAVEPVPLPAQALDHGTGYLLAASIASALYARLLRNETQHIRVSLARTAQFLAELGAEHTSDAPSITDEEAFSFTSRVASAFGPMQRVRVPGSITGYRVQEGEPAGPLGIHPARFAQA